MACNMLFTFKTVIIELKCCVDGDFTLELLTKIGLRTSERVSDKWQFQDTSA